MTENAPIDPLLLLANSLSELTVGLRLEEEELPPIFDAGLLETVERIEALVGAAFPQTLARHAASLREATAQLVGEPAPHSMARMLAILEQVVSGLTRAIWNRPAAVEWRLASHCAEIAANLSSPGPAENQGFRDLPRMLAASPWIANQVAALAAAAGLNARRIPASRGFTMAGSRRWLGRVNGRPEGHLSAQLDRIQHGLENRLRQVWLLRRAPEDEATVTQLYASAHADLFPDFNSALTPGRLELEIAKLKGLALGLQLPEIDLCFESADWLANYALLHLLPPAPSDWPIRQSSCLEHLFHGRLSRWYNCLFHHRLEPLEMAATVLRLGRPLFYERITAHALLEYSLLQGIAFEPARAPFYLDAISLLEREFQVLFDGYLLRLFYYPRLKDPQAWCDYLAALYELHFGQRPLAELTGFRQDFLTRRGLRSPLEILYRTVRSHSAVN